MIFGRLGNVLLPLALVLAPAAFADTLSWSIMANIGTYDYAGGAAPLIGTGIGVQSVQDITTGTFFNIVNGQLGFTTGASNGSWSWGAGQPNSNQLNLTGCISNVTVSGQCGAQSPVSVLLSDDFTNAQILSWGPSFQVSLGNITGNIDATLANQFGVSTVISSALFNTTTQISGSMGSSFSSAPNLGGSINSSFATGATSMPESWGITEAFELLALMFVVLAGLTRLSLLRLKWNKEQART